MFLLLSTGKFRGTVVTSTFVHLRVFTLATKVICVKTSSEALTSQKKFLSRICCMSWDSFLELCVILSFDGSYRSYISHAISCRDYDLIRERIDSKIAMVPSRFEGHSSFAIAFICASFKTLVLHVFKH